MLPVVSEECRGNRPCQFAAREKANDGDRNFLQQKSKQGAEQTQHECDRKLQKRGWFINQMRRELYTCRESDCGNAQPEQFSSEEQNHYANQRANEWDGEVHRMNFGGHGCRGVCAKRLCAAAARVKFRDGSYG